MDKIRIIFATLVLALSGLGIAHEIAIQYNHAVAKEQIDKQMVAERGQVINFAVDAWGIDYSKRNRNWIFIFCIIGFAGTLTPQTRSAGPLVYGFALPLIYQWITMTMRDLSYATSYMADSPYLLRIANPFDWILFVILPVAFVFNLGSVIAVLRRRKIAASQAGPRSFH
jgi:hypothetical protein